VLKHHCFPAQTTHAEAQAYISAMLVHFGIDRSRFKTPGGASVPTLAECATQALPGHVKNSDDQQFVRESLQTHIPEYVFELYWQTANGLGPTEREAYLASLLMNVVSFEPQVVCPEQHRAQVQMQEHGCCFTLFHLDDMIVCGCNKPACQDAAKQLFNCSAQAGRGLVRCAWFDAQTRYASVEMSADEAEHARKCQQSDENATTDGVSVCTRAVIADDSLETHASSPERRNVSIETLGSERDLSPQMCTVPTDDLLRWASDPMLADTSSEWSWSQQARCEYNDAESPLFVPYTVGERVMLRPSESMRNAKSSAEFNDGPYIITDTLGDVSYKIRREHEHYSQVVHFSRILCRLPDEGIAHTPDPSGVPQMTNQDVAVCQTSDSNVASWLNDAATQHPLIWQIPVIKVEPQTPGTTVSPVVNAGRKRALNSTPSSDPKPAFAPRKRARTAVSCVLCERD